MPTRIITSAVYLIWNPDAHIVKIGISSDVKKRLTTLQNGCGMDLNLVTCSPQIPKERAQQHESELHSFFRRKRRLGEWFDDCIYDAAEHYVGCINRRGVNKVLYIPPSATKEKRRRLEALNEAYANS